MAFSIDAAPPSDKGKPPKDDPPATELPAIRYSIHIVPIPTSGSIRFGGTGRISNTGMAVGAYRDASNAYSPYLYDVASEALIDFRAEPSLNDQLQLLAPGYRFHRAYSISDIGIVVGSIYSDQDDVQRGFAVDTTLSTGVNDWEVRLLPDVGNYRSFGLDINNRGDILGFFYVPPDYQGQDLFVCNPFSDPPYGPVLLGDGSASPYEGGNITDAGLMTRFYTDGPIEVYDVNGVNPALIRTIDTGRIGGNVSLNNSGVIAAFKRDQVLGQKKNGKRADLAVQIDAVTGNTENLVQSGSFTLFGEGRHFLNDNGDSAFQIGGNSTSGRIALLHRGFSPDHQINLWNVDELIAADDPWRDDWIEAWGSGLGISAVTGRSDQDNASGYPLLYGTFSTSEGVRKAAVLVPHDVP
ncbi:hypothetical protein NZK35_23465 [Stieleria sp. ICT_E10.1]|uniref:hypothetical protein n=1 Tax=Stieleria sedimenti TaxID=2976331 RepID=UPI00217FD288|nr:hypothetical protein [Stieleria sedimenti]MCS7469620.1 hypothetical protein [Stieleria sedimenti]